VPQSLIVVVVLAAVIVSNAVMLLIAEHARLALVMFVLMLLWGLTLMVSAPLMIVAQAFAMVMVLAEFIVVERREGVLLVLTAMTMMLLATECLIMKRITLGAPGAKDSVQHAKAEAAVT
jgi:hypothetical protein